MHFHCPSECAITSKKLHQLGASYDPVLPLFCVMVETVKINMKHVEKNCRRHAGGGMVERTRPVEECRK